MQGSTRLYLAQEYVEKQYQNGLLKDYHIKDLAKLEIDANLKEGVKLLEHADHGMLFDAY